MHNIKHVCTDVYKNSLAYHRLPVVGLIPSDLYTNNKQELITFKQSFFGYENIIQIDSIGIYKTTTGDMTLNASIYLKYFQKFVLAVEVKSFFSIMKGATLLKRILQSKILRISSL